MKKILKISSATIPLLGLAATVGATSTAFTFPSAGDTVGQIVDWANPFITLLWPVLAILVGIGVVPWLIRQIKNLFF